MWEGEEVIAAVWFGILICETQADRIDLLSCWLGEHTCDLWKSARVIEWFQQNLSTYGSLDPRGRWGDFSKINCLILSLKRASSPRTDRKFLLQYICGEYIDVWRKVFR